MKPGKNDLGGRDGEQDGNNKEDQGSNKLG